MYPVPIQIFVWGRVPHGPLIAIMILTMDCAVDTTDRLSSMSLLMGKKPNSGTVDAGTAVVWPDARLLEGWASNLRTAHLCPRVSTRVSSNLTASWQRDLHDECSDSQDRSYNWRCVRVTESVMNVTDRQYQGVSRSIDMNSSSRVMPVTHGPQIDSVCLK